MNEKQNVQQTVPITFLLPCCNTPLLTSDFLYAALETNSFDGCAFALLLDIFDPSLPVYKELVRSVRERGLNAGYFVFDGSPYCGKVNRAAMAIDSVSLCVIDSRHFPVAMGTEGPVAMKERIIAWLSHSPEPMKVGMFSGNSNFPVVTKKFVERLGYMFHPLGFGREECETWLLSVAERLELLSIVPECQIIQSSAKPCEFDGFSTEEDKVWVVDALMQTIDDVIAPIELYKIK